VAITVVTWDFSNFGFFAAISAVAEAMRNSITATTPTILFITTPPS
jgi:hypothetical protein